MSAYESYMENLLELKDKEINLYKEILTALLQIIADDVIGEFMEEE